MNRKLDKLVSPSNNAESECNDTEFDTDSSYSFATPASEEKVTVQPKEDLTVMPPDNIVPILGVSASSATPASEAEVTAQLKDDLTATQTGNYEPISGAIASSATPASEEEGTTQPKDDLSLSGTAETESGSGTTASTVVPTFEMKNIIDSKVTATQTGNSELISGAIASSATPASEEEGTTQPKDDLSLSGTAETESGSGTTASTVVPTFEMKNIIDSKDLIGSDTSKATSVFGAPKPAPGASTICTTPLSQAKATTEATVLPNLIGSDTSKATLVFGAPKPAPGATTICTTPLSQAKATTEATVLPNLIGSDTSKATSVFGAPKPAPGASTICTTPLSQAKATTEAKVFPNLIGSDTSKAPVFGAPKPASGPSAVCTTPLSEAKAPTEATVPRTFDLTFKYPPSKAPVFGAPKPASGATAVCTTPLSQAKASTEATGFPNLFGSDTKAPVFGAPKPASGPSAVCTTPLSEANAATEATVPRTFDLTFKYPPSKAPVFGAPKPASGATAVCTTPLSQAKASTEATGFPNLFGFDTKAPVFGAPKPASGPSAVCMTPLSEANAATEATVPRTFDLTFKYPPSKAPVFGAPKPASGATAVCTTPLSQAKASTEATGFPNLFGFDTKAPVFGAPKPASGPSAVCMTPLSEANAATEATVPRTFDLTFKYPPSKAPVFGAPKPASGATAVCTTPLSQAKASTEATGFPNLFGFDTKAPVFGAPKPASGPSAVCMTPLSEANAATEATVPRTFDLTFKYPPSKAPVFCAPKPASGPSAVCMTPLSQAKASTEATVFPISLPVPHSTSKQPPPLTFHNKYSKGIKVSEDGLKVTRLDVDHGVVYSARPVNINEKVRLRFLEVRDTSSSITAGFTNCDPLKSVTSPASEWSRSLKAEFCTKGTNFCYYVNATGEVHFEINGNYEGIFIEDVDTSNLLWMRLCLNNFGTEVELVLGEGTMSEMNVLSVDDLSRSSRSVPLQLHKTKSSNIQTNEFGEATKFDSEMNCGYVFTAQPIQISYKMYVQILQTESTHSVGLDIGVTSCNPKYLKPSKLPEDANLLSQQKKKWAVTTDMAKDMKRGDYLEVTLTVGQFLIVSRNGSRSWSPIYLDFKSPIWLFLNVYGATQKIRLLSRLNLFVFERPSTLTFHKEHREDVSIHEDGLTVVNPLLSGEGRAYSARPIEVNEKICLRFLEIHSRNNTILVGFVSKCYPSVFDSVNEWNEMLEPEICKVGTTLSYYFDSRGAVHLEINGQHKGIWSKRVDRKKILWAYIEIETSGIVMRLVNIGNQVHRQTSMFINDSPSQTCGNLTPVQLHMTKNDSVQTNEHGEAERFKYGSYYGYVFTAQPIHLGQTIFIQIVETEIGYTRNLAIGLTSHDPATLDPNTLPEDSNLLYNDPAYLVVKCNRTMNDIKQGDELALTVTLDGEVRLSRNGAATETLWLVDRSVPLWAFVDVCGATWGVKLLTTP